MAALKKGLQRREYFSWILKDVVTHSNNIVECLFYVGSMAGAGCEEGGKRPTLCVDTEARSWHWWLPWAVSGSDVSGEGSHRLPSPAPTSCPEGHRSRVQPHQAAVPQGPTEDDVCPHHC